MTPSGRYNLPYPTYLSSLPTSVPFFLLLHPHWLPAEHARLILTFESSYQLLRLPGVLFPKHPQSTFLTSFHSLLKRHFVDNASAIHLIQRCNSPHSWSPYSFSVWYLSPSNTQHKFSYVWCLWSCLVQIENNMREEFFVFFCSLLMLQCLVHCRSTVFFGLVNISTIYLLNCWIRNHFNHVICFKSQTSSSKRNTQLAPSPKMSRGKKNPSKHQILISTSPTEGLFL